MGPERRVGTGTNQEGVRRHNLGTLLRHVHRAGQMSRADLTAKMGLNRSTIADLVAELESLGVTERTAAVPPRSGAGRPSAGVALSDAGPYVIGVDLGVDRVTVARVGLGGVVQRRGSSAVVSGSEAWQIGGTVAALIRTVVADAPPTAPLVGIGIGVPGLVRRSDGLIRLAPNLDWHDVSFGSIVLAALGVELSVSIANDADLGAIAEHRRGAGVGIDDLIYVSGNVGVGAGAIVGGVRLEGAGGYAGEVGHLRFNPEGRMCHCGNRGCWETEVGAHAIAAALGYTDDQVPRLDDILEGYREPTRELRRIGVHLGHGLAGLVNAFNPQLVVMGGYFREIMRLVGPDVQGALSEQTLPAPLESVVLTTPGLGADSVLLGAAEIALEPLFDDPVASLGSSVLGVGAKLAG